MLAGKAEILQDIVTPTFSWPLMTVKSLVVILNPVLLLEKQVNAASKIVFFQLSLARWWPLTLIGHRNVYITAMHWTFVSLHNQFEYCSWCKITNLPICSVGTVILLGMHCRVEKILKQSGHERELQWKAIHLWKMAPFILHSYQNFCLSYLGPSHMSLYLRPHQGVTLSRWSLGDGTPLANIDGDYFVYYSHGLQALPWRFWIEMKVREAGFLLYYKCCILFHRTLLLSPLNYMPLSCQKGYISEC